MSRAEFRGSAWAVQQLMDAAQRDIDESSVEKGAIRSAVVKWKRPHPAKVVMGWFQRRVSRGEFQKRRA